VTTLAILIFRLQIQWLIALLTLSPVYSDAQVILEADGPGNTYELINSVLAPGYNVIETPECIHPEFGRHIAEVWDADLNQFVFEFYSHVTPDNDRCINFDRERTEIKTYDASPQNLKGITGETVEYKWKFRVPAGFQPSSSFTHIHQVKAVGGNDDMPLFTLTPRKGSPNKMELIHNNTTKVKTVNLSLFEGIWVEATERILIDSLHGTYSITINRVSDGVTVLSYSNNNLMTIRSDNDFIRPKWGIYRSLDKPLDLRDEAMRFAGISISEGLTTSAGFKPEQEKSGFQLFPNPVSKHVTVSYNLSDETVVELVIYNLNGTVAKTLIDHEQQSKGPYQKVADISGLKEGHYLASLSLNNFKQTLKLCIKK
jgi:hypothetical protein